MKTEEIEIPWCQEDAPRKVLGLLNDYEPDSSRFVGGCVRNSLMNEGRSLDFDIATKFEPQEATEILERGGLQVIQTGVSHGTVTAICEKTSFEITTLRRDVVTDGRHAKVKFTDDWIEDAKRRDFTFNALYYDGVRTVYDPTGQGIDDARKRRVIFIGDANDRLREDYLRILRFFRLNAQFQLECYEEGLRACRKNRDGLRLVSRERVWKEFRTLLRRSANPYQTLVKMYETGVLELVLPHIDKEKLFAKPAALFESSARKKPDELQKIMAVIQRSEVSASETADTLRLSNAHRKRLSIWAKCEFDFEIGRSNEEWRKLVARTTKEGFFDQVFSFVLESHVGEWEKVMEIVEEWDVPPLPVDGNDIAGVGFVERGIGEVLKELRGVWIESDFKYSKQQLIEIAEQRFKSMAI